MLARNGLLNRRMPPTQVASGRLQHASRNVPARAQESGIVSHSSRKAKFFCGNRPQRTLNQ